MCFKRGHSPNPKNAAIAQKNVALEPSMAPRLKRDFKLRFLKTWL